MMSLLIYFFFFKQKTAYEMRISDWSSDVCSSDLRFMPHRDILDLDRTDPFAARLHDILRAVGDLHIAFGVDRADVAGVEKTFLVEHVDRKSTRLNSSH